MNWDQIEGRWNEFKGKAKQQWGKLTDDDLDVVEGRRDELLGKVQHAYGVSREEAEKQVSRWEADDASESQAAKRDHHATRKSPRHERGARRDP